MFIIDFGKHLFDSFAHAVSDICGGIIALIGAGVILGIGWFVALQAARLVRWVGETPGFERFISRTADWPNAHPIASTFDALDILAQASRWLVVLVFFVTACYALQVPFITTTVQSSSRWVPSFLVAFLLVSVGAVIAYSARKTVMFISGHDQAFLGDLAFALIVVVTAFIALAVVAVPPLFLTIVFIAIMLALSLGGGLAIGLGGRDVARQVIDTWLLRVTARRAEKVRESLQSMTDPARTIVPVQNEFSSFSSRERL